MLAEVVAATREMEKRLPSLREALLFWRAFAADCQRLGVGHDDDYAAVDREQEPSDPASKREEKIARYKRCKELDQKVSYLFGQKREDLGDEYLWGAGSSFDEDMERELILMLLRRAVASVPENVASAQQEMPLLEMMIARGGPGAAPEPSRAPREKPHMVRIQDRAELQRLYKEMVFRCPHPLATMSIEEAADLEIEEMRDREAAQALRAAEARALEAERWSGEPSERRWDGDRYGAQEEWEDEQKLYKDRDFDAFKDEHPWGSGNKMANAYLGLAQGTCDFEHVEASTLTSEEFRRRFRTGPSSPGTPVVLTGLSLGHGLDKAWDPREQVKHGKGGDERQRRLSSALAAARERGGSPFGEGWDPEVLQASFGTSLVQSQQVVVYRYGSGASRPMQTGLEKPVALSSLLGLRDSTLFLLKPSHAAAQAWGEALELPEYLRPIQLTGPTVSLGSANASSPPHQHPENWFAQLTGGKAWVVAPPDAKVLGVLSCS
ncbi:unnamed protein product [Durusdinium trenchii]|uniref:Uncharacterized protein n=1 Tax=Durusdinium trenchii TaxID=1381693 RepID=A0ABP0Q755_9DINO